MKRLIFGIIFSAYALLGITATIFEEASEEVNNDPTIALIVLVLLALFGILMIYSGKRYLKLRNRIAMAATQILNKTRKIDIGEISQQLSIPDIKIKTLLNEGLRKGLIPINAKISYPGNGNILCNVPYAKADGRGWDIILTDQKIHFIMVYKIYWLHSLFYILTTPLYIVPIIGQILDLINMAIFLAIFTQKTKTHQKLELEDRLRKSPESYSLPISEIKSVELSRKKIEFDTYDKQTNFYLVKKLKKVSPQFGNYMKELKVQVI